MSSNVARLRSVIIAAASLFLVASAASGQGLDDAECAPIRQSIASAASTPIPREQLKDWQTALRCLVRVLRELKTSVVSVNAAKRADLLKATRAINVILDPHEAGMSGVEYFRTIDNLDVITVLSFGARSDDTDVRVNSTLVMGNVTDNTSACVPLDHLYDPEISANGRANLLAVVSTVLGSGWPATANNAETMVREVGTRIPESFADSRRMLVNITSKIKVLREKWGANPPAADRRLDDCRHYQPRWAGAFLQYPP